MDELIGIQKQYTPRSVGEGACQSRVNVNISEQGHAADLRGGGVCDGRTSQQAR